MNQTVRALVAFLLIVGVVGIIFYGMYLIDQDQSHKSDMMQACVNSGGEWRRDMGAYYECVR